jgi:UDP-N-acetylglucosamine transferase subunit ALG13
MLVASPGGHLDELRILVELFGVDLTDAVWVTARTPHTESLLAGEEVAWVPRVGSGQRARAALALPRAIRLHQRLRPGLLVSTGALFSTPHLVAASLAHCETRFIDSATRVDAPSSTGRFVSRFTNAQLFVQGTGWGDPRWTPVPSVFDVFEARQRPTSEVPRAIRKAVVTLGTEVWPFERAVERVIELLPEAEIVWQTGVTEVRRGGRQLRQWLPAAELRSAIREADVVISHAGVGSAPVALDEGKVPVFLPRLRRRREHVDDHQVEVAAMLARRDLVVAVDPDDLSVQDLQRAAGAVALRRRPAAQKSGKSLAGVENGPKR